jgi:hypothetical protein
MATLPPCQKKKFKIFIEALRAAICQRAHSRWFFLQNFREK